MVIVCQWIWFLLSLLSLLPFWFLPSLLSFFSLSDSFLTTFGCKSFSFLLILTNERPNLVRVMEEMNLFFLSSFFVLSFTFIFFFSPVSSLFSSVFEEKRDERETIQILEGRKERGNHFGCENKTTFLLFLSSHSFFFFTSSFLFSHFFSFVEWWWLFDPVWPNDLLVQFLSLLSLFLLFPLLPLSLKVSFFFMTIF